MDTAKEISHGKHRNRATRFNAEYTDQERAELTQSYETTLTGIKEYEVIEGTVVGISNRDVIINVNFKSDGLVPLNEFRDLPDLQPGDRPQYF